MALSVRFLAAFFALALAVISGCNKKPAVRQSDPVIIVNGEGFEAKDFAKLLAKQLKNFDALAAKDPANIKRAKETILREFVISSLLRQYAAAHGLSVTPQEIDDEFDRIRKSYPDDISFKAGLAAGGANIEEWKHGLARQLLERKVFSVLTPQGTTSKEIETAAREYYSNHKAEFDHPASAHIVQIVVPKEDDAERIAQKLRAGASFTDLAKKFSVAPEGKKGGDLGYVDKGTLPIFDGVFSLPLNRVSPPTKSSYGFHIMKVLDKKSAGHLTYEQVRAKLIRHVLGEKQQLVFSRWLEDSIKNAKIQRNDALLDKIKIRTEGEGE